MKNRPLVSIIIPCYNAEKTVARALISAYNQNYRPIELIIVNDGATDNTEQVIKSVIKDFKDDDFTIKYISQVNKGLGGAIDTGLKYFTGDYLAWFDSDDELLENSVKLRVEYLEANPEYASVTSDAYMVNADEWDKPICLVSKLAHDNDNPNQFELLLNNKSLFCCGCHLVRTSVFKQVNPTCSIYPSRAGQNWQMLLPVYYKNKRAFLPQPLYKCGIYSDNMTAQIDKMSIKKRIDRELEYITLIDHTLRSIPDMPDKEKMKNLKTFRARTYNLILDLCCYNKYKRGYFKYLLKLLFMGKATAGQIKYLPKLLLNKTI